MEVSNPETTPLRGVRSVAGRKRYVALALGRTRVDGENPDGVSEIENGYLAPALNDRRADGVAGTQHVEEARSISANDDAHINP